MADRRSRGRLVSAVIAAVLALAPSVALAAEAFVILQNVSGAHNATAQIDVSVDTSQGSVVVFLGVTSADGVLLDVVTARTTIDPDGVGGGFTTSANGTLLDGTSAPANLFDISQGKTALVRIVSPVPMSVIVHQRIRSSQIISAAPSDVTGHHGFALGAVGRDTHLLVGNVSGQPNEVSVSFGTGGNRRYTTANPLQPYAIWDVVLAPADANSHVVVQSHDGTLGVTVLLVEDGGKTETYP
ncbi:MAG TPA: hypothetical protein VGX21_14540 [Methylomirabilota bacterium]|nr:hypothetical protein [Methylomirabilota bacterium]